MKKTLFLFLFLVLSFLVVLITHKPFFHAYAGDGCYICTSDSKDSSGKRIHYCKYFGSDTSDQRNKCKAKGCNVTGYTSCPTAANYNIISP